MGKIDFLIFYEHKNREFESIVLLKHELVKRGYSVEFWSFYENNIKKRKALFNNVNVAVMPSLYHDEEILSFVFRVAGKVKNIVNLRWEQIFSKDTERNLDYYVYPKETAKKGYHCCWGKKPFEMLRKSGVEENNLFITGPIHMDFLRYDLRNLYLNKHMLFQQYNICEEKPCLLFSSSFTISTMNEWELESYFSQLGVNEKEYYKEFLLVERQSREAILGWLIRLAEEKDCTVIYRPHPAESKSDLTEKLRQLDNIRVISDYNIKQWILTCDQVYTWMSTSIAEASVAGVSCAALRPVRFDDGSEIPIYEDFPFISSYKQFCECYDTSLKNNTKQLISRDVLSSYMDIDPDYPSYKRTADVLEKALFDDYCFPWDSFSEEVFVDIQKRARERDIMNTQAKYIVKPFYKTSFLKRVIWKFFTELSSTYSTMISNQQRVISNREFQQLEERISTIISD